MENNNRPQWLIDAENEIKKFNETKHGSMSDKEFRFSEKQSNAGSIGGTENIKKNSEQLKAANAKWRNDNPDIVLKNCTNNGYLTMSKYPNLAKENGKKTGAWAVESGHLDNVRDINKMLEGSNKIIKCPHCEKEGQLANMKRWHYDNCKFKKI